MNSQVVLENTETIEIPTVNPDFTNMQKLT